MVIKPASAGNSNGQQDHDVVQWETPGMSWIAACASVVTPPSRRPPARENTARITTTEIKRRRRVRGGRTAARFTEEDLGEEAEEIQDRAHGAGHEHRGKGYLTGVRGPASPCTC